MTVTTFGPTRLSVSGLPPNTSEEDAKVLFTPFGDIEGISLQLDPATNTKCGFVQ
jgi:RNA recognition motif-containing protein